jgi:hypothetical protein
MTDSAKALNTERETAAGFKIELGQHKDKLGVIKTRLLEIAELTEITKLQEAARGLASEIGQHSKFLK